MQISRRSAHISVLYPPNLPCIKISAWQKFCKKGPDCACLRRSSNQDRERRVQTLLETAGLTHAAASRSGTLSRVEKRRLTIAFELMGDPDMLLLDESAEQLTPFEEVQVTILLRQLSRQGLTIIQSDQRARNAGLSDKVIFLAPGGLLAWFGPPDEAFIYLKNLVPEGLPRTYLGSRKHSRSWQIRSPVMGSHGRKDSGAMRHTRPMWMILCTTSIRTFCSKADPCCVCV